ncbi:MAG: hypothetical protein ACO3HT_10955, partial [Ilumatobacteraceae bacterium]
EAAAGGTKNAITTGVTPNKVVKCDPNAYSNTQGLADWTKIIKGKTFTVTQGDQYIIKVVPSGGTYAAACTSAMNFVNYTGIGCNCSNGLRAGITYAVNNNETDASYSWYTGGNTIYTEYQIVFDFSGVPVGKYGLKMGPGAVVAQNLAWGSTNWKGGRAYSSVVEFYFTVNPGPDHVGVDNPPGEAAVGEPMQGNGPTVSLRDQADQVFVKDGQAITVSIDETSGDGRGSVAGMTSSNTVQGAANFAGLIVNGTVGETYTLVFSSGALTPATATVTIATPGPASDVWVESAAAVLAPGRALTTQPIAYAADAGGNLRDEWVGDISVSISGGDGNGSISGTTTVSTVGGRAVFTDLVIDGTLGETYTLTYSGAGLNDATHDVTFEAVPLEIVATMESSEFGSVGEAGFTVNGTVLDGDEIGSVEFAFEGRDGTSFGPSASPPTEIGDYTVTPTTAVFSSGSGSAYSISYTSVDFSVTPISVTLTADDLALRVGEAVEPTVSLSRALAGSDAVSAVSYSYEGTGDTSFGPSLTAPAEVGSYSITPTAVALQPGSIDSYVFSFGSGVLNIGTIPVEIQADSNSLRVGETLDQSYTLIGDLLEGDEIDSVVFTFEGTGDTSYAASTTVPTEAGTYSVTPNGLAFATGRLDDYEVTYTAGSLVMTVAEEDEEQVATDDGGGAPGSQPVSPEASAVSRGVARYFSDVETIELPALVESRTVSATHNSLAVAVEASGDADGDDLVEIENSITVTGTGFTNSGTAYVWLFSSPTYLGEVAIESDGSFSGQLSVPTSVAAGNHALHIVTEDGSFVIPVERVAYALPATGVDPQFMLLLAVLLMLGGFVLMNLWRTRKVW